MTQEQQKALKMLQDGGGVAPREAINPELRVGLVRQGLISLGKDEKIRITERGRLALT